MAVVVAAAGALTLGAAGGAHAGTWSHTDPGSDMITLNFDGENIASEEPATSQTAGDVRRVVAAHTSTHVVIRFNMRTALPRTGWTVEGGIVTRRANYGVRLQRTSAGGALYMVRYVGDRVLNVRCSGLKRTISGNTVRLVVPRSCVGSPVLVRVGLSVFVYATANKTYADDGLDATGWDRFMLSPRIYRG